MRINVLALWVLVVGMGEAGVLAECPCGDLSRPVSEGLQVYIASAYGLGETSPDAERIEYARRDLIRNPDESLPCLLHIYRKGLVETGLGPSSGPTPTDGSWALALIEQIDLPAAIEIYNEQAKTTVGPDRIAVLGKLVLLGDSQHIKELLQFLQAPVPRGAKRFRHQQLTKFILEVISKRNSTEARDVLVDMNRRGEDDQGRLPIYIAQLSGDVQTLRELATNGRRWVVALLALKRMGADSVLQQLAEDSTFPHRAVAEATLRHHDP